MKTRPRFKTVNKRPKIKELDKLWAECIKERAGRVSEYSGKSGILHAHHIVGKANYRLRWELKNGISITGGEHKFIAHHMGRAYKFRARSMRIRSLTEDEVLCMERQLGGTDLFGIKAYLEGKLDEFKRPRK